VSKLNRLSGLSSVPQGQSAAFDQVARASSSSKLRGAMTVPIGLVVENPNQVRKDFSSAEALEALEELANDIRQRGILEPLLVREVDGQYEVIAGERRRRAAKIAELTELPVIVKNADDRETRLIMLVENVQRRDLKPEEERDFFLVLQSEYNYSVSKLAELISKSTAYVSRRLNNRLQEMQSQEIVERETLSDENHNLYVKKRLNNNSQPASPRQPNFSNAYKRFFQALDSTTQLLEQQPPDSETALQIETSLVAMEEKITELRQKLYNLAQTEK